jgi:hypothetical protein
MKLCNDCEYRDGYRCIAPQNMRFFDPMDGKRLAGIITCKEQRTGALTDWLSCRIFRLCGKGGRWFKQYKAK